MEAVESVALWPAWLCGSGGAAATGARQGGGGELGRGTREAWPRFYRAQGMGAWLWRARQEGGGGHGCGSRMGSVGLDGPERIGASWVGPTGSAQNG
jgi:hypothetical protein